LFTGLIEHVGEVREATPSPSGGVRLWIALGPLTENNGVRLGDSIAVDGCCLTATQLRGADAAFEVVPESVRRTTLGRLRPGQAVNLERALPTTGRFGGHIVQGHVDGTAEVLCLKPAGQGVELRLRLNNTVLAPQIAEKGSVALAGVSLTVAGAANPDKGDFWLALIPETMRRTTLGALRPGDEINVETDVLAKYVFAALQVVPKPTQAEHPFKLTEERLRELGF
jgi:riboflavin synthase